MISFLFFSFLFFFFRWIFSSPLVRLHFFSWYNNCFFLLFFIPLFSLQTYAFFLYILCTQQLCQVHIISFRCNSVCFICFLFLKNGHAWVESTYHITYVPIFFILRSTVYRVHHSHCYRTEYNIGWPICAHWYHALFSPSLSPSFLACVIIHLYYESRFIGLLLLHLWVFALLDSGV